MYFNSDKLAIRYSKAVPIQEGEHDNVVEIVKYLAAKEKMPMPKRIMAMWIIGWFAITGFTSNIENAVRLCAISA